MLTSQCLLVSNKSSFHKKAVGKLTFICEEGENAKQLLIRPLIILPQKLGSRLKVMMRNWRFGFRI